jgi:hypothetical protein
MNRFPVVYEAEIRRAAAWIMIDLEEQVALYAKVIREAGIEAE